jgi:hypothetical protein
MVESFYLCVMILCFIIFVLYKNISKIFIYNYIIDIDKLIKRNHIIQIYTLLGILSVLSIIFNYHTDKIIPYCLGLFSCIWVIFFEIYFKTIKK